MRKLILGSLFAAVLGAFAAPASAHAAFYVSVAPPPPPVEYVPAPRVGWVWAPGHWHWRHGHYIWVRGHWLRERVGYVYASPRWVAYGPRWVYVAGGWRPHHRHWY